MTPKIAEHAPLLHTPRFFAPGKAYITNYAPDIEEVYNEGIELALRKKFPSAADLISSGVRRAQMLTDLQKDFMPNGRLPVPGGFDVILRTVVRLINLVITAPPTDLVISLDGHSFPHCSIAKTWRDPRTGRPLDLARHSKAACVTLDDEKEGMFRAYDRNADGEYTIGYYQWYVDPKDMVAYWKHLQATGQGDIWVFVAHCMIGTDGVALHPFLEETLAFVCGALGIKPTFLYKGHIINTDWFGAFRPCRPDPSYREGGERTDVLNMFKECLVIESSGLAEDICKFSTESQIVNAFEDAELAPKLRVLSDCTAPIVPNAPHVKALNERIVAAGGKIITHDTPFES